LAAGEERFYEVAVQKFEKKYGLAAMKKALKKRTMSWSPYKKS
jgi:hypothetical protein